VSDHFRLDDEILMDVVSAVPGIPDHVMLHIEGKTYRRPIDREKAMDLIKKLADVK